MDETLFQHGQTILWLSVWCLLLLGIGRLILGCLSIPLASPGEGLFLAFAIGLTLCGYAVFLWALTGVLDPAGLSFLLVALLFLSATGWLHPLRIANGVPKSVLSGEHAAQALLGILLLASFLLVLTPEVGKDALIYHLAVPKRYLLHHGFHVIPGNIFADYPLLAEMHYVLALFLQNDILAKTMNFTILCGILGGMGLFSRFLLRENRFPAMSMLIFLSIPSVFFVSHTAYNDLFVTFYTLASLYCFLRWSQSSPLCWLTLSGMFAGSAAACKYTALLLTPLGLLGILWLAHRQQSPFSPTLHRLMLFLAAALLAGCPFYLKNGIATGNPFHPFLYGFFGGRGWDADQARLYDLFVQGLGMGRSLLDYLMLPWNVSLRARQDSPQFDGILGPVFLLTLPFLAGLRPWGVPLRLLSACLLLSFLFWASSAQQIRYLIPLIPLMALLTGSILGFFRGNRRIFPLLICLISASLAFNGYYIVQDFMKIRPVKAMIGMESRDAFLSRTLPHYPMYRFVNSNLRPDDRVFLIYMKNFTFLCDRDCYSDSLFEAHTLQKILQGESTAEGIRNRLADLGFTHLLYDEVFLLGGPSPLSEQQKNRFHDFRKRYLQSLHSEGPYHLDRLVRKDHKNGNPPRPPGAPYRVMEQR